MINPQRRHDWMTTTRANAKALLRDLFTGPDEQVKYFLSLLQSKYFSQDVAMLIHHLNIALAEREKVDDLEKDHP